MYKIITLPNLILCLLFISGNAFAGEDKYAPVRDTIKTCFACHGENGSSTQPLFPVLAGQEYYYLYLQLQDFKSGLRDNATMGPIVAGMEKSTMKLIAEYFSKQTWPGSDYSVDDETAAIARKVINSGQCVACHLGAFNGNSRVPRLANQHPEYLEKTMLDFKTRARNNMPDMSNLISTYSDKEIKALAQYLSAFPGKEIQ